MTRKWFGTALAASGLAVLAVAPAAGEVHPRHLTDAESVIAQSVRKELNMLANYGVFDSLQFFVDGNKVVLTGQASRPTLKSSAERVVKGIEGVDVVINQIEVLPLSRFDDRIRTHAYARIYGHSVLSRYNPGAGPIYWSSTRASMGITNDPPIGYHAIRIIVNKGNITLEGAVDNEGDKAIAGIQANTTPGAFAVKNNLHVIKPAKTD
jgi:hypothetical protein